MKIRKYKCIKQFPNTDAFSVGDIIEIEKKDDGSYIIDGAILTDRGTVYSFFEIEMELNMKYAPYSFSRMETWVGCPQKFRYIYILKPERTETPSPILEKGTLFHSVLEHSITDNLDNFSLDTTFKALNEGDIESIVTQSLTFTLESKIYKSIKSLSGVKTPEKEIFLNKELKPTQNNQEALIRGFIDLLIIDEESKICHIYDWKTGGKSKEDLKRWPKPKDQLELYAIWATQTYDIETVETAFVYVEHDYMAKYTFTKNDIHGLKEKFSQRIDSIENDKTFCRKISQLCAWCDFREDCVGLSLEKDPRSVSKDEINTIKENFSNKTKKNNNHGEENNETPRDRLKSSFLKSLKR